MLFDISGRRRRSVVKGVYGGLALLFLVGFVGFGVGSDVGSGLLGSGHGGGSSRGHGGVDGRSIGDQREDLQERVERNRRDATAWRQLSVLEAGAAYDRSGGHGGGTTLADDGARRLNESVAAYEEYRDLVGRRRVDRAVAQTAASSYAALRMFGDAVAAQGLATRRDDVQANFLLAQYAAQARDSRLVERAMRRALAAAPRDQRPALREQRDLLRRAVLTVAAPAGGGHGG